MILLFPKFRLRKYLLTKALYEEISLRKKVHRNLYVYYFTTLQQILKRKLFFTAFTSECILDWHLMLMLSKCIPGVYS